VPATFYLRPGTYQIEVEYRGTNTSTSAQVAAGEDRKLALNLPADVLPAARTTPVPVPRAPAQPPPADEPFSQKTWGWVGVGASVALGGAAIIFGVQALSARDQYRDSLNHDRSAHDKAANLRLATNLLWGGATAAGATGLILLLTAPSIEF
jgi:hypothetical protein